MSRAVRTDARPGGRDGRRPERHRDRGATVAGATGATLALEDPGSPHLPADVRGVRGAARPRPGRRPRAAWSTACPTVRPPCMVTPSWQYPNGGHDAGRAPDAAAAPGPPRNDARRSSRTTATASCATRATRSRRSRASTSRAGPLRRDVQQGALPGAPDRVRGGARAGASRPFVARHEAGYRGPGALEQRALALFLAEGHFERHLARVRAHFAERQAALLACLAAELGTVVSARPAAAGAHLVVRIEDVQPDGDGARVAGPGARRGGRAALVLAPPPGGRPGAADPLRAPLAGGDPRGRPAAGDGRLAAASRDRLTLAAAARPSRRPRARSAAPNGGRSASARRR